MFSALVTAGIVVGAVVLYLSPLRWSLVLVLAVAQLVPTGIVVPHSPTSQLTVPRLAVAAFATGVLVKARKGMAPGAFRLTRMHLILGAYLAVAFVLGVALAPAQVGTRASLRDWWSILEFVVFFTAAVAALRQIDPWWMARAAVAIVFVTAVIAAVEHVTRGSYSGLWFRGLHELPAGGRSALSLQTRGGQVRVQAASLFALEYAWVAAMWLPLVAVVALWSRRRPVVLAPLLVVAVINWTYSRSVWAGLLVAGLVLVAGSGAERRLLGAVAIAGLLAVAAVVASPSLRAPFHASDTAASTASRVVKVEVVGNALAPHPFRGLGLGGLHQLSLQGTDLSFLLAYAELGAVGVVLVVVLFATALGEGGAALRIPKGRERSLAAGALSGMVMAIIAAGAYDFIGIEQSMLTLMFLTAFAIAIRERCAAPDAPKFRPIAPRAAIAAVAVGVLAGTAVWGLAPRHWAGTWRIETVLPRRLDEENSRGHEDLPGTLLFNTVCAIVHQAAQTKGDVRINCPQFVSNNPLGAGIGDVRIEAPRRSAVDSVAAEAFGAAARYLPGFSAHVLEPEREGTPSMARAAPVCGGLLALALAVLVPVPVRRPAGEARRNRGDRAGALGQGAADGPMPPPR